MNIFVLDSDPVVAAQSLCDKHVVKMTLESAQLLCSAYDKGAAPYRQTHINHPCAVWTRASRGNWLWLLMHANALSAEYTYRYQNVHASQRVLDWCAANPPSLPAKPRSTFAQAMPEQYKREYDPVGAYRAYYVGEKLSFARYTRRSAPAWLPPRTTVLDLHV